MRNLCSPTSCTACMLPVVHNVVEIHPARTESSNEIFADKSFGWHEVIKRIVPSSVLLLLPLRPPCFYHPWCATVSHLLGGRRALIGHYDKFRYSLAKEEIGRKFIGIAARGAHRPTVDIVTSIRPALRVRS
jgi:hypothetical protein